MKNKSRGAVLLGIVTGVLLLTGCAGGAMEAMAEKKEGAMMDDSKNTMKDAKKSMGAGMHDAM